jgi:hypothetical protein
MMMHGLANFKFSYILLAFISILSCVEKFYYTFWTFRSYNPTVAYNEPRRVYGGYKMTHGLSDKQSGN